ncbi:hypothetical protein HHI36_011735 [Cryptolaemus montrouzieri]|uniref:Uncharacterized protein n=1 Tax=Cryptolaemus montrouzieri TaxID=559131 RepID=A0ABD2NCH0_9CUCU
MAKAVLPFTHIAGAPVRCVPDATTGNVVEWSESADCERRDVRKFPESFEKVCCDEWQCFAEFTCNARCVPCQNLMWDEFLLYK